MCCCVLLFGIDRFLNESLREVLNPGSLPGGAGQAGFAFGPDQRIILYNSAAKRKRYFFCFEFSFGGSPQEFIDKQ
jgi:hypothetical protein